MRIWLLFGIVLAVLGSAAVAGGAGPQRFVLERHRDRGVCARAPHQLCTLFSTSLSQRQVDEGVPGARLVPAPRITGGAPPTPPASFLAGADTPPILSGYYAWRPQIHGPVTLPSHPVVVPSVAPATIMIVDYDHDPNAESDLGVFRAQFGLRPCTIASGCLTMWNTSGTQENPNVPSSYPTLDAQGGDGFFQVETMLDLEAASSLCPTCNLALVEVDFNNENTNTQALFFSGVNVARTIHPAIVSLSYAWSERTADVNEATLEALGIPIVAASGDSGYEQDNSSSPDVAFPASSPYVTAVGWTNYHGAVYAVPTSGSGCSAVFPIPQFQRSRTICAGRAIADISAQGSWFPEYDSYCPTNLTSNGGSCGWYYSSGTSMSTPIIAGLYAQMLEAARVATATGRREHCSSQELALIHPIAIPAGLYTQPASRFVDVKQTAGTPNTCSITVLCQAGPGWDGPTGFGNPTSIQTFLKPPSAPVRPQAGEACQAPYAALFTT